MEQLTLNDIQFLVALLASEESPVLELKTDLEAWNVDAKAVQGVLAGLVQDGTIGVNLLGCDVFSDFSLDEAMTLIKDWENFVGSPFQLFLTDLGYKRWDTDDWSISIKRANFLMFSNKGNSVRV